MKQNQTHNNGNDLYSGHSIVGLFHRGVMLLLWPLRRPHISIPLLLLMYLVPTFIGARPTEVHIWYWNKIKNIFTPVSEQIISKGKDLIPEMDKLSFPTFPSADKSSSAQRNIDKVVPAGELQQLPRRQTFEKQPNIEPPSRIDIMEQKTQPQEPEFESEAAPQMIPDVIEQPKPEVSEPMPLPDNKQNDESNRQQLDLIYLSTPQEISGEAYIVSANEIVIGENDIYLFGIYVDPNSGAGLESKEFLETLIGSEPVKCIVEAYSKQGIATGMCYVRNININYTMVKSGMSQNVALPERKL